MPRKRTLVSASACRGQTLVHAVAWFRVCPRSSALAALLVLLAAGHPQGADATRIVLIGGAKSEGPARHDYANGVRLLQAFLESSPQMRVSSVSIEAHPDGWPEPAALEGASVVVWYFDGEARHPLLDAGRRAAFEALMARGAGLVALHQSSTVPAGDATLRLERWLGAARHGYFDRANQDARLRLAAPSHPVSRGVKSFAYHDEFYPTFRRASHGGTFRALLTADVQAEFRAGRELRDAKPERAVVGWTFERGGGGRAFGFSGAHHLAALDQPELRRMLLNAIVWCAYLDVPRQGMGSELPDAATRAARTQTDTPTFHRDARRSGWNPYESALTPARVARGPFGLLWESAPLDGAEGQPPRLYASPLYVDHVAIGHPGRTTTASVVYVATNAGYVYAIAAFSSRQLRAGEIVWRTRLAAPCRLEPAPLDGIPTGVLSTPVIDAARNRIYVTHCDPAKRWQAYALDLRDGAILPGWPVRLDEAAFNAVNRNAGPPVPPTRRHDFRVQRAALNLSPGGEWLYVGFGETETGWVVAVDTVRARIASAFATQAIPHRGSGGVWGAGGPAVGEDGSIYVVTGTGYGGFVDRERDWTQSLIKLSHDAEGFVLRGTYTPFNHCATAANDIDLGSGGASLMPPSGRTANGASQLMVLGGKQGNAYLLDAANLPGRLDRRPPCSEDSASDGSLLAPQEQPQFGKRGPLNVFGPYSEKDAAMDVARARSVPAQFRAADGRWFVFVSGNTRKAESSAQAIPPSLVRLEVVSPSGTPPHLRVDQREMRFAFGNPGSPFVTSNAGGDAIVWVLDENAPRSASLAGPGAPLPVLYAFDALSLALLWKSEPGELHTSGKYNQPAFARGIVLVGTDRIQAFGVGGRSAERAANEAVPAAKAGQPARIPGTSSDGRALYQERCATCHDHPQGNIPPREVIARRTQQQVVDTLTRGAMRPHAHGLDAEAIEALARYLQ